MEGHLPSKPADMALPPSPLPGLHHTSGSFLGRAGAAAAAGQPHPGGLRERQDREERQLLAICEWRPAVSWLVGWGLLHRTWAHVTFQMGALALEVRKIPAWCFLGSCVEQARPYSSQYVPPYAASSA